jgi:hypothetical protein
MEREQIFLLMEIAILEIMLLVRQMAREFINGKMEVFILESLRKE